MESAACQPHAVGHLFTPGLIPSCIGLYGRVRRESLSSLVPKWSTPDTPLVKVTLPPGDSAPHLTGRQKPLSRGFVSNLKDFLTERPVKLPKNDKGVVFTSPGFGDGLTENLREWFKPTPKAVASRMAVE